MWEWLKNLFGDPAQPAPLAPSTAERSGAADRAKGPVLEGPRQLTPLDAAMVLARVRVLGLLDQIDERYHSALDRTIKAHCRERRVEPWWGPIKAFADERRSGSEGSPCFQSFSVKPKNQGALRRSVVQLEAMLSGRRFQIVDVRDHAGDELFADDDLGDGEYQVRFQAGDKRSHFVIHVKDGAVDGEELIGTLNRMIRGFRWPDRLFLLGPHDGCYGVAHTTDAAARKAHGTGWGRLIED